MSRLRRFSLAAAFAALLGACGEGIEPSGPSFEIDLETSHTMAQGDIVEIRVTIERTSFDGPIAFSVQQASAGLIARFQPGIVPAGETTTTLIIETSGDAPPGDARLAIAAAGGEAPQKTRTLEVAIFLRGSYTLELLDTKLTVAQGGRGTATALFRRLNANGSAVSVAVTGLPAGISTLPTNTTTGPGSSISFITNASAAVGTYPVTITSSAAGTPSQSATLSLSVIAPPVTSDVSLAFCPTEVPGWFAYQNEGYGWQRATPQGSTFSFAATERVAVAYAFAPVNNESTLFLTFRTRAEFADWQPQCDGSKTITGSVSGLASGQRAHIGLAGRVASVTSTTPNFTLTGVPDGVFDLAASRGSNTAVGFRPDRFVLRTGLAPTAGSTLPTIDFAAEGFVPVTRALTIAGLSPNPDLEWALYFYGASETAVLLQNASNDPPPTTLYAFPASALQAGDVHTLEVIEENIQINPFRIRERGQYTFFSAPSDQSVSLAPALPDPQIELVTNAPYPRFRARIPSQPAYDALATIELGTPTLNRAVILRVSAAYLGGTPATWDLVVPDFGDLSALGFNPAWLFPSIGVYYADAVSSPVALYFGARPEPGDIQRYASIYAQAPFSALRAGETPATAAPMRGRGAVLREHSTSRLRPPGRN